MLRQKQSHSSQDQSHSIPDHIQARLEKIWQQAYQARTKDELKKLYANWAASYDIDHEAVGFFGHFATAELLRKHIDGAESVSILDAGAGTGAAGTALTQSGFTDLTGVDLSNEMLSQAEKKQIYQRLLQADLGFPLDDFSVDEFDAAVLVGVFSYGQAPAHALDELIRVVKPGGVIVFTLRTDFYEDDEMTVRSRMTELQESSLWELVEVTEPEQYLPNKDPDALFQVWCFRVTDMKYPPLDEDLVEAVETALTSDSQVKRFDHRHIWNSTASRLYNQYIVCPQYYLNDCEEEILRSNAEEVLGNEEVVVELGCGSAQKVKHLLNAADQSEEVSGDLRYVPIDLSPGALNSTREEIEKAFNQRIPVEPIQAPFEEVLPRMGNHHNKLILFFGSSIGNLESLEETIAFLQMVREGMHEGDRFLVGMDLHKEERVLRDAYEAGEPNRLFFLNIVRRLNDELGANLDLTEFYQQSTYDLEDSYRGITTRCVNFKLVTRHTQEVDLPRIGMKSELKAGEAVQVGISRKFRTRDIEQLASHSGFELRRQWFDQRQWFSLNELVPAVDSVN